MIRESYGLPSSGNVNVAYIGRHTRYTDGTALDLAKYIAENKNEDSMTLMISHGQLAQLTPVWVGYGDCPAGTALIGYVGRINGMLMWIDPTVTTDQMENPQRIPRDSYVLPDRFAELFESQKDFTFPELVDR